MELVGLSEEWVGIDVSCLARQSFDSEIFGVPYYRIVAFSQPQLAAELLPLSKQRPVMIDAKVPADQCELARWLQGLGFRLVCTQIALTRDGTPTASLPGPVQIAGGLALDEKTIAAHAANFRTDRHSLDPMIEPARHDLLYRQWIANSLSGRMMVASEGRNFCSFRGYENQVAIDLLSVLDKRRGVGGRLVNAVLTQAGRHRNVRVVTECANDAAWRLYLSHGFQVESFIDCLHFVAA